MKITKYKTNSGLVRYQVFDYLGLDLYGKKRNIRKKGFQTAKEAREYVKKVRKDYAITSNVFTQSNNLGVNTFDDLFNLWYESYKHTVKPITAQAKLLKYKAQIKPKIGKLQLFKITPIVCQKLVNDLAEKYNAYSAYVIIVNKPLKYAVKLGLISSNPLNAVIFPKPTIKKRYIHQKLNNIFNRKQLKTFLAIAKQVNYQYYCFFRILAFTGLRPAEALALTFKDINKDKHTLTVNKVTYFNSETRKVELSTPKNKSSNRVISIDDDTINIINTYRNKLIQANKREITDDSFIFLNTKGNLYQSANLESWLITVYRYCPKDLPVLTSHNFRKTHASLLLESGANLKYIQKRLGHSNIQTTMNIYTKVNHDMETNNFNTFINFIKD